MLTPRTTAPPGGVRGRLVGGACLGLRFGFGLWLRVGVGVGEALLGVGLADGDRVGEGEVLGDVDVDDVADADELTDDEPETEADEEAGADKEAACAAVARAGIPAAAAAGPPAHGSNTMPADIRTTPVTAHVRPAIQIRPAGLRMVVLIGRFGLGARVMTRPPLAGAFGPGAW
jgi:hypothetical protein